jgi:NADH dehydrogenase
MKLPSLPQQIRVGLEWGFGLVFPRTLAHLKADRSGSVRHAFYRAGDIVFRENDPAAEFYVIEQGEMEVIKATADGGEEIVAVLGSGDFFGEGALVSSRGRSATVRARIDTEVVVLGRNVFTQISASLAPLRDAVAKAAKRRTNIWKNLHEMRAVLDSIPIKQLVEPLPDAPLTQECRIEEAISKINTNRLDFYCVTDENEQLCGIITRSDLLRAIEVAAALPDGAELRVCVKDIMVKDPITVGLDEMPSVAVTTMREHGLKTLPVLDANRALKGYLRIENIMDHLMKKMLVYEQRPHDTGSLRVTKQMRMPSITRD